MKATLTVQPLYNGAQSGDIVGSCEVEFTSQDAEVAASELGHTIIEAVQHSFVKDPDLTAFDMTMEVQVEDEDLGKRAFIVEERTMHRVLATSQAEAEAIYRDKGGEFISIDDFEIYEQGAN